jgi:hypothetical protein
MAGIRKVDTQIHRPRTPPAAEQAPQTSSTTKAAETVTARPVTATSKAAEIRDTTTTAPLRQTAEAHGAAEAVVGEQASTNALDKQSAVHASHAGRAVAKNELTPEYKLAKQLGGELATSVWHDKAPPELQAMASAIGPQVSSLATQTAATVLADPTAMANISSMVAKVGKDGFTAAVTSSTKGVADHFLKTAGVSAKNPEAIKAALSGMEALAPQLGGTVGPKIAATAKALGPKLLGDGAEVAAKAAGGAAKTAATGAKALPIIGNVVAVGSTLLAGANLISQIAKSPRDMEKILKEGVNTLTQGIGIAFPWVALGGTLTDAAWSAKVSVSDNKKAAAGELVTENANVAASLPLLTDSAEVLRAALQGAGKTDAADKLGNLVATTKTMANLDLHNPGDRVRMLRTDEQQALVSLAHESRGELEALSTSEAAGTRKEALVRLAGGFGALADTTLATMRLDKREAAPGFADDDGGKAAKDLKTKRNELAGSLVKQLGELGLVEALRARGATPSAE